MPLFFVLVLLAVVGGVAAWNYFGLHGTGTYSFSSVEDDLGVVREAARDAEDELSRLERTAFEGMTEAARRGSAS